jgi:hypothetical protein
MKAGSCPACGGPVQFRFSNAVQTVCEYCQSILVRHDVNLDAVGKAADIPEDASPIQMMTEGIYRGQAFQVVGRIAYEYELGRWNEWHLAFGDGRSGWLSDAQLEYAVTFKGPAVALPAAESVERGQYYSFENNRYRVTTLTHARYAGVEGELPFEYWDKAEVLFADLRSHDARFATIDYSEQPPLLFLGETFELEDLKLTNLREFEGWSR